MLKRFIRTQALLVVAAGLMAGCNTTSRMDLPKLKSYELMEVNKPLSEQTTFALSKIVANLKRGTTIIHFPAAGVEGIDSYYCNYSHQGESTIEWGAGTSVLGNWGLTFQVDTGIGMLDSSGMGCDALNNRPEASGAAFFLFGLGNG